MGAVGGWTEAPAGAGLHRLDRPGREGEVVRLRPHDLRAARAMLDWSMVALARASALSLSTVRRLETEASARSGRTQRKAIAALRGAGVRFTLLEDGVVAVSLPAPGDRDR